MWEIIPEQVKELHKVFSDNGKKIFLVGGAVRDFVLGIEPKDFDLTTDSLPDDTIRFLNGKYKLDLVGKSFGVIIIHLNGIKVELAVFREDIYGEKLGETRNPDIKFSTIEGDIFRRDITMNGLYYDMDKRVIIDLVGGIDDIKNKIIRFIGEPALRIEEDPLRIMRCVRSLCRF